MRQLNGLYCSRFNRRHGRCGHVFQGRYRSILIERETHLLRCARYIVLYRVRAGICEHPGDYRWSSYRATVAEARPEVTLALAPLLELFGPGPGLARAQAAYRAYVGEGIADALTERVQGERLGSDAFLRESFGYKPPLPEIPRPQVEPLPPTLAELFARERLPVAVAYRRHGYTLAQIAAQLGCHNSTVSRRLRREEAQLHECKT